MSKNAIRFMYCLLTAVLFIQIAAPILLSVTAQEPNLHDGVNIPMGSGIYFGALQNQPVLWRYVYSQNGGKTLISEYVLYQRTFPPASWLQSNILTEFSQAEVNAMLITTHYPDIIAIPSRQCIYRFFGEQNQQARVATLRDGTPSDYWLSTSPFPDFFDMCAADGSISASMGMFSRGVRPVINKDMSNVLFAWEEATNGGRRNFRLTILGEDNGNDVGSLSPVTLPDMEVMQQRDLSFDVMPSFFGSQADYSVVLKLVRVTDGHAIALEFEATQITTINIPSNLDPGSYRAAVWLQRNRQQNSHEATRPVQFMLNVRPDIYPPALENISGQRLDEVRALVQFLADEPGTWRYQRLRLGENVAFNNWHSLAMLEGYNSFDITVDEFTQRIVFEAEDVFGNSTGPSEILIAPYNAMYPVIAEPPASSRQALAGEEVQVNVLALSVDGGRISYALYMSGGLIAYGNQIRFIAPGQVGEYIYQLFAVNTHETALNQREARSLAGNIHLRVYNAPTTTPPAIEPTPSPDPTPSPTPSPSPTPTPPTQPPQPPGGSRPRPAPPRDNALPTPRVLPPVASPAPINLPPTLVMPVPTATFSLRTLGEAEDIRPIVLELMGENVLFASPIFQIDGANQPGYITLLIELHHSATGAFLLDEANNRLIPVPARIMGQTAAISTMYLNRPVVFLYVPVYFTDIANHWAREHIYNASGRLFVQGVGYGRFEPDRPIPRREFAQMLVTVLGLSGEAPPGGIMADVKQSSWYYNAVNTAFTYGLLNFMGDVYFEGEQSVTREELARTVANIIEWLSQRNFTAPAGERLSPGMIFQDAEAISCAEHYNAIATAISLGIMRGVSDNTFAPAESATRAQAIVVLMNTLQIMGLI